MKLTTEQIAEIEKYISSWNLVYKEVYDEMIDHYCSEIETKMAEGIEFNTAFNESHKQFENLEKKVSYGEITEVYGLKALETLQYSAIDKKIKNDYFKFCLKHVISLKILFWIGFILLQYKVLFNQVHEISFDMTYLSFWGGTCFGITYICVAWVLTNSSVIDTLKNSGLKFIFNLIFTKGAQFEIRKIAILKLLIFPIIIALLYFESFALIQIPVTKISLTIFLTLFTFSLFNVFAYLFSSKLFIKDLNILKIQI